MTLIRYFCQMPSRFRQGMQAEHFGGSIGGAANRCSIGPDGMYGGGRGSPATHFYPVIVGGLQYGQGCSPARSASRTVSSRPLVWVRHTLVAW